MTRLKKASAMLLAFSMPLCLCACSKNAEAAIAQPNTTYEGTVSAISTASITISAETEEIAIALTDNTVYGRDMGMGDAAGMPEGNMPGEPKDTPEKPDGEASDQDKTPPEKPGGENSGASMGADMPLPTISDISIGTAVTVVTDENGSAASVTLTGGMGGKQRPGGMDSGVESYDAAAEFTADAVESGKKYASTAADENAIHVCEDASVAIANSAITRDSGNSTGGDRSSFYGIGAAALVTDGTLTISDSTINTDAAGGTGIFAYGNGIAYVMDTAIDTAQDTSGGIHVAGGGTLYAWDLDVETDGESSAAIRSDRGSGTMVIDGGSYTSNGIGSPAIYSAADISVRNAKLVSSNSEAVCIEGLNSIRLFDCNLSGNMQDLSQNDCTWNVILYQSMSGDSEVGNSTFEMVGGSLSAGNGGMFYTTNTESTFILSGVDITYADENDFFLKCTGNANQRGWGTSGSNGADCRFTAVDQTMKGDIIWDSISQLDFYALEGSMLTGAAIQDETCAGNGGSGYCNMYLGEESTWVVTGDSVLTNLYCSGTITDTDGNTVTIRGTDGTVYVSGSSAYTITVSSYNDAADVSGASSVDSWNDFAIVRP